MTTLVNQLSVKASQTRINLTPINFFSFLCCYTGPSASNEAEINQSGQRERKDSESCFSVGLQ